MITHIVSDWLFSPCCVEHQDEFIFERVAVAYSRDYNEVGRAQIKSNPLSVLPVFKHQNQNVDIPIIVFFISFLFVTFETTIIKENLLKNSFKSHKI